MPCSLRTRGSVRLDGLRMGVNAVVGWLALWQPRISYGYTVWLPTTRGEVGMQQTDWTNSAKDA